MTLKIEITASDDDVRNGLTASIIAGALGALGFVRASGLPENATYVASPTGEKRMDRLAAHFEQELSEHVRPEEPTSVLDEPSVQAAVAKRERGKPSPGRARRTKEEIAEDEVAERLDVGGPGVTHAQESGHGERPTVPAISTGEERVDPATAAQDAADEAAETAAGTTGAPTLDDLRRLMGAVSRKHGLPFATQIPAKLGKPIAELTDDELPNAIAQVQALLDADDPNAAPVTTAAAPAATKQDLLNAMFEYADFADGTRNQADMKWTMVDVPVVFDKLFGVQKLSEVPADGYGKAIAGIREMLAKDPFNRKRV